MCTLLCNSSCPTLLATALTSDDQHSVICAAACVVVNRSQMFHLQHPVHPPRHINALCAIMSTIQQGMAVVSPSRISLTIGHVPFAVHRRRLTILELMADGLSRLL